MTRTLTLAALALSTMLLPRAADAQYYYGRPSSEILRDQVYRDGYGDSRRVVISRGSRLTCRTVVTREVGPYGDRIGRRKTCRPNDY